MKKYLILPLLLVLFVSFSASAKGPGKRDWQWWQNEKITSEIDLSQDQSTQLNDIAAKFEPTITAAREDYDTKRTAFSDAKSNPTASSGDVIKAFDTMWDSKYKMKRIKLDRGLEMKSVLTPEQVTKLAEIKQAHKEKMMKKGHKMKHKKEHMKEQTNQ